MYDMYEKVVNRGEETQGVEDGIEGSKWAGVCVAVGAYGQVKVGREEKAETPRFLYLI